MNLNTVTNPGALDLPDIQGLLLNGYQGYNYIRHLLFTIPKGSEQAARQLCTALLPGSGSGMSITTAERWDEVTAHPPYRLNIGITSSGLKKLVANPSDYKKVYNKSYTIFMAYDAGAVKRAPFVNDYGTNDPSNWWKGPSWQQPDLDPASTDIDIMLSLYAPSTENRCTWGKTLNDLIPKEVVLCYSRNSDPIDETGDLIHFNYHDGISQPRIQGAPYTSKLKDAMADDRPVVPSWNFIIQNAADAPYNPHPLLLNGSFGAFRVLVQDVVAFDNFIAKTPNPELVAAKMCGRWRDGTPIEVSPDAPDPSLKGFDLTNFNYITPTAHQQGKPVEGGDDGTRCPFAAHIRRANPRDDYNVLGNGNAAQPGMAASHRILRRARPFGPPYDPAAPTQEERGLIGLFIGASLVDQFEFIMHSWVMNGSFRQGDDSPNESGVDPLFGPLPNSAPAYQEFDYLSADGQTYTSVKGLPQFVTTAGGLYVFLPSVTALHCLSQGKVALA
jgi:deferrochelatase/peroxidase EfeB